jgi:hypothetical protein
MTGNNFIDPSQIATAICENDNKTLRVLFKGKINGSFLIKVKSKIFERLGPSLFTYYSMQFDNARIVTGTDETPQYDICRMIVGVHRHHSIFLSEEKIRKNIKSTEYQEQIINEVIEKIELRQFGSRYFRKMQLFFGDEFLYFPVPYELFALCMKSLSLMAENAKPQFTYYIDLMGLALSSLTLMENNFLSNAYPLCRSMIELHLKTLILDQHPEALKEHERFRTFEIKQSCCSQDYPDEFIALYNAKKHGATKVNYLHYGWLDSIDDYNTRNANRYSIYGILAYLKKDSPSPEDFAIIEALYKMCHGYTHGSVTYVKYPLLQYFEISIMIYHVIRSIFPNIYLELKLAIPDEDKSILNILDRDMKTLKEQYDRRSTPNFELYYKLY